MSKHTPGPWHYAESLTVVNFARPEIAPPVGGDTLYTRQQVEAMLRVALTDRTDEWTLKTVDERVAALLSMFTLPTATKEKP